MKSSGDHGESEYVPGRSTSRMRRPPCSNAASFFSTVTPGQFPTWSRVPAMALMRVDFPELGFPATAMVRGRRSGAEAKGEGRAQGQPDEAAPERAGGSGGREGEARVAPRPNEAMQAAAPPRGAAGPAGASR